MMSIQRSLSYSSKSNKLSSILRLSFSSNVPPAKSQSSSTENVKPDVGGSSVPGLSSKVVNVPSAATGPGASKSGSYKNPEYFCYHQTSYFDAEIEMAKYRIPQPSAK